MRILGGALLRYELRNALGGLVIEFTSADGSPVNVIVFEGVVYRLTAAGIMGGGLFHFIEDTTRMIKSSDIVCYPRRPSSL